MSLSRKSSADSLLAQLRLQDVQALNNSRNSKGRQVSLPTDDEFPIALYEALLEADVQSMQNRRLVLSLARAGNLDGAFLDAFVEERIRAMRGREYVMRLFEAGSPGSITPSSGVGSGFQSPGTLGSRASTSVFAGVFP